MGFWRINDIKDNEIRKNLFALLSNIKSIKSEKIIHQKIELYSSLRENEKYNSDLYRAYSIYIRELELELTRRYDLKN